MKRHFVRLILSLFPLLGSSCVGDHLSWCRAELILEFNLNTLSDETFGEHIHSVDVFLFDRDKHFYTQRRIDRAGLADFAGAKFRVHAGRYYVVCWANVGDNTGISAMHAGSTPENSYLEIVSTASGDEVWYAPEKTPAVRTRAAGGDYDVHAVDVSFGRKNVRQMTFIEAHRTVQVYIKGYEHTEWHDGEPPRVQHIGEGLRSDFLLCYDMSRACLEQSSEYVETPDGKMHVASIHFSALPIRENAEVNLLHPTTGEVLAGVNLEQYIARNEMTDHSVIPIQFTFMLDTSVSITLPRWQDNPVEGS